MAEDRSERETLGIPAFVVESSVWDTPLWFYGFVVALLTYVALGITLVVVPASAVVGFEILLTRVFVAAWLSLPVLIFFDAIYVGERRNWTPDAAVWTIAMVVWVANVVAGILYLRRRYRD